ncbi:MAG: hypothetical protein AB7F40_09305 [Victivallaceae bacterium]|nr:hypothetical protein [Victivallaceae bacterium]
MKIIQTAAPSLSWVVSGEVRCSTRFRVVGCDAAAAELLAGAVGDNMPLRAAADHDALERDASLMVTDFSIDEEGETGFLLKFNGRRRAEGLELRSGISEELTGEGETLKRAEFVLPSALRAARLPAPGDAAEWAGDGFLCVERSVETPHGGEIKIKLTAKRLDAVRLLSVSSGEQHLGYNALGVRRRNRTWHGVWSVPARLLADFPYAPGGSAEDWAADNTIITSMEMSPLSNLEYRITLEARDLGGWFSTTRIGMSGDDRSNLADRVDVEITFGELRISAAEAGWRLNERGYHEALAGWDASKCPVALAAGDRCAKYDRPLKTMVARETRYYSGSTGENLELVANWRADGSIHSGKVGNLTAKWLKAEIRAADTADNSGRIFTRIDRYYRLPPEGEEWNAAYWDAR